MEDNTINPDSGDERPKRRHVRVAGKRIPMPQSRKTRIAVGVAMVIMGMFGFLPVLGFWMIPVGLLILSQDLPAVRRRRRQLEIWWYLKKDKYKERRKSRIDPES